MELRKKPGGRAIYDPETGSDDDDDEEYTSKTSGIKPKRVIKSALRVRVQESTLIKSELKKRDT